MVDTLATPRSIVSEQFELVSEFVDVTRMGTQGTPHDLPHILLDRFGLLCSRQPVEGAHY